MCIPDCPKKPHDCYSCEGNRITQNLNQNVFGLNSFGGFVTGPGGLTYLPQNGINIANANGYNNQIDQNLNQNGLGLSGFGGGFGIGSGFGGLTYLPQTGINIANANSGCAQTECRKKSCGFTSCSDGRSCHSCGGNQINQNLNQNGLGLTGFGSLGTGFGGLAYLPQNGINIANANGWNNQINQNLNQNAFGS